MKKTTKRDKNNAILQLLVGIENYNMLNNILLDPEFIRFLFLNSNCTLLFVLENQTLFYFTYFTQIF